MNFEELGPVAARRRPPLAHALCVIHSTLVNAMDTLVDEHPELALEMVKLLGNELKSVKTQLRELQVSLPLALPHSPFRLL